MKINLKPENLFLKYAFPCLGVMLARGDISQQTFDNIESLAIKNKPIDWQKLEKIFPVAIERLKQTAKKINKKVYSTESVKSYFLIFHNQYIKEKKGSYKQMPESLKNLCRIERAIITKTGKDYYIVNINKKDRAVSSALCPDCETGDKVSVHYGYAVEKISNF